MNIQSMNALLPVPSLGPSFLTEADEGTRNFRDHGRPHNGIVYIGHEANRFKSRYESSGKTIEQAQGVGLIIDVYV